MEIGTSFRFFNNRRGGESYDYVPPSVAKCLAYSPYCELPWYIATDGVMLSTVNGESRPCIMRARCRAAAGVILLRS